MAAMERPRSAHEPHVENDVVCSHTLLASDYGLHDEIMCGSGDSVKLGE